MTTPTTPPPHQISDMPQWISVKDQLPTAKEVICWDGEAVSAYMPITGEAPHRGLERCEYLGITHWMPLPEAPTAHSNLSTTECLQSQPGDTCQHAFCQPVPTATPEQAKQCAICERPFKVGDDVYSDTAMQAKHGADAMAHKACEQLTPTAAGTPRAEAQYEELDTCAASTNKERFESMTDFARTLERELAAAQAELVTLRLRFAAFQGGRTVLEQAHADTLAKLEEAKAENLKLRQLVWSCKDHDNEFEQTIEHLRAKLTAAEQQVAELEDENQIYYHGGKEAEEQRDALQIMVAEWRGLFGAKEEETAQRCREIWQTILDDNTKLNRQVAELTRELNGSKAWSNLQAQLRETEKRLTNEANQAHRNAVVENEQLKADLATARRDTERMREALQELYPMAISHCRELGWAKHPSIDKAYAALHPSDAK